MAIQKFGLEIRKTGNIDNLYKDVDAFLAKYKIPDKSVTGDLQRDAVGHALQKMFDSSRYLDVCTVKQCAEMCKIIIPKERMNIYQSNHCIHWNEMTEKFRNTVIAMILDDFRPVLQAHS